MASHENRSTITAKKLSRRGFLVAGASALSAMAVGFDPMAVKSYAAVQANIIDIQKAAGLYLNFTSGTALAAGVARDFASATSSVAGTLRAAATNLLGPMLPFAGGSVSTNALPAGLEWHSSTSKKTLLTATSTQVIYRAETLTSTAYYGGFRTVAEVLLPGQSALLSFNADIRDANGDSNGSLTISLLRIGDQKTTVEARAFNDQELAGTLVTTRIKAPAGGAGGYRLVFSAKSGISKTGQQVTVAISNLTLIAEPPTPAIGERYALPPYIAKTQPAANVLLSPNLVAGTYHVIVNTQEFGWGAASTTVAGSASIIDLQSLYGPSANFTVKELYVVDKAKWQLGWLDVLEPAKGRTPLRFMEIGGSASTSRAESPNRLSRATGLTGSYTAAAQDITGTRLMLASPVSDSSAAFNPARLSHLAFQTSTARYIGDTKTGAGVRSEIQTGQAVAFDKTQWISLWVKPLTTLDDSSDTREAVLFQYRYTTNSAGDTSSLSPELGFQQIPNNRFRIEYRSDRGVPDLTGDSSSTKVTDSFIGPFDYVLGQWSRLVVKVRFSKAGGGYLGVWYNGKKLIDQSVAIGYCRDVGPSLHFGSYKFSDYPSHIEFQQLEFGTRDLSSRISAPLAV